ncbi:capsule assembly Wzi family protein [Tunturiibacter gelidoferens]|uniref:Membrane-associated phospholipid phosphatase n=1 Tax=Tunturiibacter lichenicola TaxID=2051959 RepID=A0A7Y9T1V3_9BACT|nr:capsule assembly Wzi family protein [Edaphobacter lichenicola]NYF50457.1 membrane-associated phospholipid phosphatase [Edaphobacter lichenicola]
MLVAHPKPGRYFRLAALLLLSIGRSCFAQDATSEPPAANVPADSSSSLPDAPEPQVAGNPGSKPTGAKAASEDITFAGTPRRLLADQKAIWTSPLHLRPSDAIWLAPLAATTGVLIGSDQHTMTSLININANDRSKFNTFSNAGVAALGALPASMYLWSLFNDAPQAHETGLLAGEALADSLAVSEVGKFVFLRDRPLVNNAKGDFFSSSPSAAGFPSNHATAAWALASVVGDEYPGWITRTAVYGLAAGVSVSRVLAEQHFPSDVLIGSATGWLIGHYVYRAHHNFSLNPFNSKPLPDDFGKPRTQKTQQTNGAAQPVSGATQPVPVAHHPPRLFTEDDDPDTIGSTNVPMDSWVYPALERLAAMGFIPGQSSSIRPWTRQECLRQLKLAEDQVDIDQYNSPGLVSEARRLVADLHAEFETEPNYYESLSLESVYGRYGTIAGPALADSFHFGQTWWNDFGRPLGRGSSAIFGYSVRAHHGRLFFYDRQELQHSPGNPAESPAINQLINVLDRISPDSDPVIQPIAERAAYNRQRPIELYGGVAFAGNELSFGKQELYWGPTTTGPLAFSSNAEPTYSLRLVSTRPHPFPLVPSLGTYRFDVVLGKLSGHSYPARPWYNGQKVDFNFGDNLEISFTRWSIFWGVGHPITPHSFKANIFSFNSTGNITTGNGGSGGYGDREDPGDRKSNFDFTYRLPFLRRLVTLYADAYSDDDPSPIAAPRRAVWNPGIYFARLPFLPHMDLRVEAVSSEGLAHDYGGTHFFINNQYLDGNTNKGFLLGNAVGRDARAIEARSGYWFSARTRVEAGYRQSWGGNLFLPNGGRITDGFVNGSYAINRHWQAQIFTQYERFLIPSYMSGSQHNTSGWFQIAWTPELHLHR